MVLPISTIAMGKAKVAKGKVTKLANNGMDASWNVHKTKTKAMHGTVHDMKKVKKNPWACLCPMVKRRRMQ